MHGYIFPETGADGVVQIDDVQREALAVIVDFLDRHRSQPRVRPSAPGGGTN